MPFGQEILLIFDPPDLPSREEFVVLRNQLPTANFRFAQPLNLNSRNLDSATNGSGGNIFRRTVCELCELIGFYKISRASARRSLIYPFAQLFISSATFAQTNLRKVLCSLWFLKSSWSCACLVGSFRRAATAEANCPQ